ncbi:MAG: hypothetical protein Q9222_004680 [Ikaeria aurantiellina]
MYLRATATVETNAGPLSSWLARIKHWLDRNPYDVVTILLVNSDHATATDLSDEFDAAAITPYAYTPASATTPPGSWPTLDEFIGSGQRLIAFVADMMPSTAAPYLLNEFNFIFENPYDVTSLTNFSCIPERPAVVQSQPSAAVQSGRLPLMNHFLDIEESFYIKIPDVGNITTTNAASGAIGNLGDAAIACTKAYGKPPTFILVDFFEHGASIDTVDQLNHITPVGRRNGSTIATPGVSPSGAIVQPSNLGASVRMPDRSFLLALAMMLAAF